MKKLLSTFATNKMMLPMVSQSPKQLEILSAAQSANNYFMNKWPDPTKASRPLRSFVDSS